MTKVSIVKGNSQLVTKNEGGKEMSTMVKVNEEVRYHCLHCNEILNKKGRKYCNRDCYNASRKTGNKTVEVPVKTSVSSGPLNDIVAFEKALKNMQHFKSALTINRLKKLVEIAGETAHVIRVGGGIVIYWFIDRKGYMVYYAPGKRLTYKESHSKEMRASVKKLAAHKTFKDIMGIIEYIALAEQMKGGE